MRFDMLRKHQELTLTRRQALKAGAAGAAAMAGSTLLPGIARAHDEFPDDDAPVVNPPPPGTVSPLSDEMFDVAAVEAGAWADTRYGRGDQKGTFNEVTAAKTAAALALLDAGKPVHTYNLGELLFNGFPAFPSDPPRVHDQVAGVLAAGDYVVPPDYGGFILPEIPGANLLTGHEERIDFGTYQIATQLDGLNHIGVGAMFYGGYLGPEILERHGTTALANETMGPIVTRGVVLDIVGLKRAQGERNDLSTAPNGETILNDTYRITIRDIQNALRRERVGDITPGDVVLFRTGWTHLVRDDPQRYLASEPGIWLAEARYLARRRPAIIGSDTWGLETINADVIGDNPFAAHQLLITGNGIRIGEGMVTEDLVNDGIFEFVYIVTPQHVEGATAGNTPPIGLANPRR
jgi:kynurenine formamidase